MNKKKKALLIAYNDLNNSGVPNVIYQTVKAICKEWDIDIITFSDNLYYFEKMKVEGITNVNIIRFDNNKPKTKLMRFFFHFFTNPKKQYKTAYSLITKNNYDVVHSFKETYSWPFFRAAKKAGIQLIIHHSNINAVNHNSPLIKLLDRRNKRLSLKYANCFIGVSDDCCKHSFKKHNYQIIHNGYDETKFNMSVSNRLNKDELVLTQVATFNENKNQIFSIMILKELINIYPNSRLILVGKNNDKQYFDYMLNTIESNKLHHRVKIIDGSSGIGNIFCETTFTLLPSHSEGAPITSIESQACGIQMFASTNVPKEMNVGGMTFLKLEDGPKKWAESIATQFKNNGNRRIGYNLSSFSTVSFREKINNIYNS